MSYYDGADLPFYWNVADEYTLFDHFFSSARTGPRLNAFFRVAGVPSPNGSEAVSPGGYGGARLPSPWSHADEDAIHLDANQALAADLAPHALGQTYVKLRERARGARAAYSDAIYDRLARLKRQYDQANMFCRNQNVRPAPSPDRCSDARSVRTPLSYSRQRWLRRRPWISSRARPGSRISRLARDRGT